MENDWAIVMKLITILRLINGHFIPWGSWIIPIGLSFKYKHLQNGEIEKSAIAVHVWKEKHAMDHKSVQLKQAANKQELTNWENILITKNKDRVINFEIPPTDHLTKKFILNPVEGSRSAPTRISNQGHSMSSGPVVPTRPSPILLKIYKDLYMYVWNEVL